MTAKQIDLWGVVLKRVIPVLSIAGTIMYYTFYMGGHFAVIENNQVVAKADINDLKSHVGKLDTAYNRVSQRITSFEQKYSRDRETDSLKRQLVQYQNKSRPVTSTYSRWNTIHRKYPGGPYSLTPSPN